MAEHLTIPGALEWDAVERHSIATLRYAGGKEHDVKYVSEVAYDAALAREAALREELNKSQALSVTRIMLDIVPGDGSGLEVYAKSCADVEKVLTELWIRIEDMETASSPAPVAYRWRIKGDRDWTFSPCNVEFDARSNDPRFEAQALYGPKP